MLYFRIISKSRINFLTVDYFSPQLSMKRTIIFFVFLTSLSINKRWLKNVLPFSLSFVLHAKLRFCSMLLKLWIIASSQKVTSLLVLKMGSVTIWGWGGIYNFRGGVVKKERVSVMKRSFTKVKQDFQF